MTMVQLAGQGNPSNALVIYQARKGGSYDLNFNSTGATMNIMDKAQLDRIEKMLIQLTTKKKAKPRSTQVKYPAEFEDVWREYPKRVGSNPKKKALGAWFARGDAATFTTGDSLEEENTEKYRMLMGAVAYCQFCDATVEDKRFVMQAATFFGPDKHYENDWTIPETIPKNDDEMVRWAAEKGYRKPYQTESYSAYRSAVKSMHRGM